MPVVTRASNNNNDMEAMQREIMEMVQQLQKKTNDTEMNITNFITIKCDTLEENVKHYINSVVFAYIDNIVQHTLPNVNVSDCMSNEPKSDIIVPASNQTGNEQNSTENTNTPGEVSVPDHTDTENNRDGDARTTSVEESINSQDRQTGEDALIPSGLEPSNILHRLPVHDVYIGGTSPTTTEDGLKMYLVKIGVTPSSIMSVDYVTGNDSQESAFRVKICDTSIRDTVYNKAKFKQGIIVKPFRYYLKSHSRNVDQISHHSSATQPASTNQNTHTTTIDHSRSRDSSQSQYSIRNDRRPRDSSQLPNVSRSRDVGRTHDARYSRDFSRSRDSSWQRHSSRRRIKSRRDTAHTYKHSRRYTNLHNRRDTRTYNDDQIEHTTHDILVNPRYPHRAYVQGPTRYTAPEHQHYPQQPNYDYLTERQPKARDDSNRYERQHEPRDFNNRYERRRELCDNSNRYERQHEFRDHSSGGEQHCHTGTTSNKCRPDAYESEPGNRSEINQAHYRQPQNGYCLQQQQISRPCLNVYATPYTPQQQPLYTNQWSTAALPTAGALQATSISTQQQPQQTVINSNQMQSTNPASLQH